jgi:hypothetical protein
LLAEFVQLVPKGIDLPLNLLERRVLWGDEQPPILAPAMAQQGCRDGRWFVWIAGLDVQLEGSEEVHRYVSSYRYEVIGTHRTSPVHRRWVGRSLLNITRAAATVRRCGDLKPRGSQ